MRLLRYLTFSNVIALIALFIALGGAAYAGSKLNGKNIVKASIGGGKLKHETITGDKINLSTLGTVPYANAANSAAKATTATTATSAENAGHANSASHATEADSAVHAKEAENAVHASEADSATNADHATEADSAMTAGDAATIEGASRAELTVSCRTETEFYGGMCWDEANRQAKLWINAIKDCGNEGGRLPTIGELIAFVSRPGIQVVGQTWSGDLADVNGGEEEAFTSDELGRGKDLASLLHSYRCVFPQAN